MTEPAPYLTHLPPASLTPYSGNARTHSKKQIRQIAASIDKFGFNNPVLIDEKNGIVAGHGRVAAAQDLGLKTVPCVRLDHLSEAQKRAYILADNRLAEKAGWDQDTLAIELQHLMQDELDFDVGITGFEMAEIDVLLDGETSEADAPDPDDNPPEPETTPVTQIGDVWQIGPHRLICGDARERDTYFKLLGDTKAQMVFTDPPFNVPIQGHVSGLGKTHHREFAMASGELSPADFTAFLKTVFDHLAAVSRDGALHFIAMDWRHMREVSDAGQASYSELKNLCVWAKTNGGMGSLYRSQHELFFVFKAGAGTHINNVELGKHGRYRTNVWSYAGANAFNATRASDLAMHPTVKPVALVTDAILDCSNRKGLILDAFAGSGTTLVAAHRCGRVAAAIEIDPLYCDVIVRRMMATTELEATLEATGQRFSHVAAERRAHLEEATR